MNKYIAKLLNKLSGLMTDNPTAWSMIRYVTILTCTGIILTWVILSFKNGMLMDIPASVVVVFGIAITGKVVQKGIEDKGGSNDSTNSK